MKRGDRFFYKGVEHTVRAVSEGGDGNLWYGIYPTGTRRVGGMVRIEAGRVVASLHGY